MIDFSKLTVFDTETTSNKPNNAEIAQLAVGHWEDSFIIEDRFYGTREPMPFAAMAVNHITREMIDGLPLFMDNEIEDLLLLRFTQTDFYIAHNINYDSKILKRYLGDIGLEFTTPCICTMRLSEKILGSEIELKNLGYLRYALALPVRKDIGATHRADTDVEITGLLYQYLIDQAVERGLVELNNDIHNQMFELCWKTSTISKFPIGKWKGKTFEEVPTDYYIWLIENSDKLKENSEFYDPDFASAVKTELERRLEDDDAKSQISV